jgi:two-component system, NarL family, nitrate/nitrite response regulator NarL
MRSQAPKVAEQRVRIAVIDEHQLYRAGIGMLLAKQSKFEVVGEAGNAKEALALLRREQPDITLISIDMNGGKNIEVLPELFGAAEMTRVVVLTGSNDPQLHRRAVHLGAVGVVSKEQPADTLIRAIERVHAGEAWLDRSMMASVLREMSPANRNKKPDREAQKLMSLSGREREVIKLVGEGLKNKQIAERLFISEITVHHHLTSIYSKLEISDRLELLIYAYRNGLAEVPR